MPRFFRSRFSIRRLILLTALVALVCGFLTQVQTVSYQNNEFARYFVFRFSATEFGLWEIRAEWKDDFLIVMTTTGNSEMIPRNVPATKQVPLYKGLERSLSWGQGYSTEKIYVWRDSGGTSHRW